MADYKLVLPAMGEGVIEATITGWLKQVGEFIDEDESIVEVATDKVDSEVPSPVSGTIKEILANVDDVVAIEAPIAIIELEGEASEDVVIEVEEEKPVETVKEVIEEIVEPIAKMSNSGSDNLEAGFLSPLVKSMIQMENITDSELAQIKGTGNEGRITKEDIKNFLENRADYAAPKEETAHVTPTKKVEETTVSKTTKEPAHRNSVTEHQAQSKDYSTDIQLKPGDEIIEMDRMRKLIAKHMITSKQVSPHVNSVVETDMTSIVNWRNLHKEEFLKVHGEKLTFMPIIIQALVKAITDFPMINVSVNGDKIIKKRDINIGVATALPNGNLIVPVIKNADQYNLRGLAKVMNDLATRARENKLKPEEVIGGTYTITNIGSFGNVIGSPIINQPQVAIMAIGAIEKKPAVIETPNGDLIGIRHKMYLSHTYDHRVVDGALGGMFVKKVSDYLEGFDLETEI